MSLKTLLTPVTYWLTTLYPMWLDEAGNRSRPSSDVIATTYSLLQLNQPIKTNFG